MENEVKFLDVGTEKIAYFYVPPKGRETTVMFLHGFFSSMNKTKGNYLKDFCLEKGYGFLSLDYSGHGQSSGDFEDGSISQWLRDCEAVIRYNGAKNLILVGSSLGGWMMVHLAMKLPDLVRGLIGIAVAPDFTKDIPANLTAEQQHELDTKGRLILSSDYNASGVAITKKLIDDARDLLLLDRGGIPCNVPVRLLHGVKDTDSPFDLSLKLMHELTSADIEVILIKEGSHTLSEPNNLQLLRQVLVGLIETVEGKPCS